MKTTLIILSIPVGLVAVLLGGYTFFFGIDGWTINRRVEERRAFCKEQPVEFWKELLEDSKPLMSLGESIGGYEVAFLPKEYVAQVPEFILRLKPQSIYYRNGWLNITLDRVMDLSAEILINRYGGEYRVIGRFGRSGFPSYEEMTFLTEVIEADATAMEIAE